MGAWCGTSQLALRSNPCMDAPKSPPTCMLSDIVVHLQHRVQSGSPYPPTRGVVLGSPPVFFCYVWLLVSMSMNIFSTSFFIFFCQKVLIWHFLCIFIFYPFLYMFRMFSASSWARLELLPAILGHFHFRPFLQVLAHFWAILSIFESFWTTIGQLWSFWALHWVFKTDIRCNTNTKSKEPD